MKCPNCAKSLWFARTFCPFCRTSFHAAPLPPPLKIVCWVLIGFSALGLVSLLLPSPDVQHMLDYTRARGKLAYLQLWLTPFGLIVSALFILRGINWARWLLLAWLTWNLFAQLRVTSGSHGLMPLLFKALVLAGSAFYLFRADANAFFRDRLLPLPTTPAGMSPVLPPVPAMSPPPPPQPDQPSQAG